MLSGPRGHPWCELLGAEPGSGVSVHGLPDLQGAACHRRALGFWSERWICHTYCFRSWSPNVEKVFRAQRAVALTGSGKQFGEGRWDLGRGVGCRPLGWGTSLLLGSCLAGIDRGLLEEWGPLGVGRRLRFGKSLQ